MVQDFFSQFNKFYLRTNGRTECCKTSCTREPTISRAFLRSRGRKFKERRNADTAANLARRRILAFSISAVGFEDLSNIRCLRPAFRAPSGGQIKPIALLSTAPNSGQKVAILRRVLYRATAIERPDGRTDVPARHTKSNKSLRLSGEVRTLKGSISGIGRFCINLARGR